MADVDSYRFLSFITKKLVKSWIDLETPREIPWTPLAKPLSNCNVALISSGGIALKTDEPFDQDGERQNPWWGDPSFRVIPRSATENDVEIYHLHVNAAFAKEDLNCLLPTRRLEKLARLGEIGGAARNHYSFMGYILQPEQLLKESVPKIVRKLKADHVDAVILVPA